MRPTSPPPNAAQRRPVRTESPDAFPDAPVIATLVEVEPALPLPPGDLRRHHREMLVVAALVVAASLLLTVRPDGRCAVRLLPDWPLPASCLSQSLLGIDCPGCGLTRSFVCLAQGDWASSLRQHRMGWLVALAVLIQFPYRLIALLGRTDRPLGRWAPRAFAALLIAALLANWVLHVLERCAG